MYEAKCDICHEPVKPADSKGQLARNLGLHKRVAHGIQGRVGTGGYVPVWARPGHPKYDPNRAKAQKNSLPSAEQLASLEKAREARREERARAKQREEASKARPLAIDKCPKCDGEFLRRVKGRAVAIKVTQCEACGIRFYYTIIPAEQRSVSLA